MKEKIELLKVIRENIDTVIYILEGNFGMCNLDGNGTIREQIGCFNKEGDSYTEVFESIINEHGKEQCPHAGAVNVKP
ncbi:hypothetical protein [Parabacteroides sp. PF5-9]|uniref:hypothetical protein n=1 Tax=Parabacteroides sp. PF5-9 TaxID=1742404 RepID=UPI0024734341|nr:hypothetical protein [Parabacteroides sp. PF5-9]MDH6357224.1 hypothetical protein [Parabacteroides sp. PF5-9]